MLGTAFFAGLRSTSYDMKYSADRYYDAAAMMDLRILGTYGITEEDIRDLQNLEGVAAAEGFFSVDAICRLEDKQLVMKVMSVGERINLPVVTEGRLPADASECFIDAGVPVTGKIRVGQKITLSEGREGDVLPQHGGVRPKDGRGL
jgi:putative ABC transport system permease protein